MEWFVKQRAFDDVIVGKSRTIGHLTWIVERTFALAHHKSSSVRETSISLGTLIERVRQPFFRGQIQLSVPILLADNLADSVKDDR